MTVSRYLLLSAFFGALSLAAAPDHRPPLDKSAYRGTVWSQVNPWWVPNKMRTNDKGGPNYARKIYTLDNIWGEAMTETAPLGLTGWQFELHVPAPGFAATFKVALDGALKYAPEVKMAIFLVYYGTPDLAEDTRKTIAQLELLRDELKQHPNVYRLNGRPVISIYTPGHLQPEEWGRLFDAVEQEFGPFVWLMNTGDNCTPDTVADTVRRYLSYFDGTSMYGNWGEGEQARVYEILTPVMHREFPQKIFEGGVQNAYSNHFHFGGVATRLSKKYRDSWDTTLAAQPDSVVITNFFDHYENSLILPCYEREDFMLRYAQYRLSEAYGNPFPRETAPELVVTNYTNIRLGARPLDFEVMSFPIAGAPREIRFTLDICDTAGTILHSFPEERVASDQFAIREYTVPSEDFAGERAVTPRLRYHWDNRDFAMNYNPSTVIDPSLRTNVMFWARSTRNTLLVDAADLSWSFNGCVPGDTALEPANNSTGDQALIQSRIKATWGPPDHRRNPSRFRLMRNGLELEGLNRNDVDFARAFPVPSALDTLDYYHLELENAAGNRIQTLPVWVESGSRPGSSPVPIATPGGIRVYEIENSRVPFFYYPCAVDTGTLLLDASGYQHNGTLKFEDYGGGHLGYTGYRHEHNGPVAPSDRSIFARDENGAGMLTLDGTESLMIMGGTAMPGASTYEIAIRPARLGQRQGIFGTVNGQMELTLEADGQLLLKRNGGEYRSNAVLQPGQWYRIAAVYDLRNLTLFVDGQPDGSVPVEPNPAHDSINHLTVGARCEWLFDPADCFQGDLRDIRIYGRNLAPEEFLR